MPGLFVICSAISNNVYDAIWNFIISKIENFKENIKCIVCDYNSDFVEATQKNLPTVRIRGSWINFIRVS